MLTCTVTELECAPPVAEDVSSNTSLMTSPELSLPITTTLVSSNDVVLLVASNNPA